MDTKHIRDELKQASREMVGSFRSRTLYCRIDPRLQYLDLFMVIPGTFPNAGKLAGMVTDAVTACDAGAKELARRWGVDIKPSTNASDSNVKNGLIIISRGMSIWGEGVSEDDIEELAGKAGATMTNDNPFK